MPTRKYIAILLLLLIPAAFVVGQTQKEALKGQYDNLLEEIKRTEDVLRETKKNREASLGELEALQRKIDIRRRLIGNISDQIGGINSNIGETTNIILSMERDLDDLRSDYSDMVYQAYVHQDSYDKISFIFSSRSFMAAVRKVQYLKEYSSFRRQQIGMIQDVRLTLADRIDYLEVAKEEKRSLLVVEEQQKAQLSTEKSEQDGKIRKLKNIEKKLLSAINKKKNDADALNRKIESIIASEIRREQEKALMAANRAGENTGSQGSKVPKMTPEMMAVSSNFSGNQGRLPWPVTQGTLIGKFGKRLHPLLRDPPVYIQSNGIDISTVVNADVRAIFGGEVVNIISNPSFQKGVIVKHGDYFTVYTKLKEIAPGIVPGAKVTAKQALGKVYTDTDANKTEVHLEIWKGTTLLNPESWLARR